MAKVEMHYMVEEILQELEKNGHTCPWKNFIRFFGKSDKFTMVLDVRKSESRYSMAGYVDFNLYNKNGRVNSNCKTFTIQRNCLTDKVKRLIDDYTKMKKVQNTLIYGSR